MIGLIWRLDRMTIKNFYQTNLVLGKGAAKIPWSVPTGVNEAEPLHQCVATHRSLSDRLKIMDHFTVTDNLMGF
ncbi:hypothetical protein CEXT_268231 [Caerostris extrusa]|uniref:Uncharacterized protein n=1 Tax=Caerostris extrusa TaxID=172846 RepID=A0AAV4W583_CAEEX|nr:hypothetical protein CEXT_268231 [Caerostris extrusa]